MLACLERLLGNSSSRLWSPHSAFSSPLKVQRGEFRWLAQGAFMEMQNGIHVVGVEGRMKVEDGGKRGVTQPFWLRIVGQHGFITPSEHRALHPDWEQLAP